MAIINLRDVRLMTEEEAERFDPARLRGDDEKAAMAKAEILRFYSEHAHRRVLEEVRTMNLDSEDEEKVSRGVGLALEKAINPKLEQLRMDVDDVLKKLDERDARSREAEGNAHLRSANPYERSHGMIMLRNQDTWDFVRAMARMHPDIESKGFVPSGFSRELVIKNEIKWLEDNGLWNRAFAYRKSGFFAGQKVRYGYIVPSVYYEKAADSTSSLSSFVPITYLVMMLDRLYEEAVHRQYCRIIPVPDKTGQFPRLTAGLGKAAQVEEGASRTTGNLSADDVTYTIRQYAMGVLFNLELLSEARLAPDMVSLYARELGRALAEREKYNFWFGNGTSTPNDVAGGSNLKGWTEGLGAAAAGNVHEVTDSGHMLDFAIKARGALGGKKRPNGWRSNLVWAFNGDMETELLLRTNGQGNYIFDQNSQLDRLANRPVIYNEEIPDGKGAAFVGNLYFIFVNERKYRMRFSDEGKTLLDKNQAYMVMEHATDGMPATSGFTDKDTQCFVRIKGAGAKRKTS